MAIVAVLLYFSVPAAAILYVVVMSARPGRITEIVPIGLGAGRDDATRDRPEFFAGVTAVREALRGVEGMAAMGGVDDR